MLLVKTKQKNHNATTFQINSQHFFTWPTSALSLAMSLRTETVSARASPIYFAVSKTPDSADAGISGVLTGFLWWLNALVRRGQAARSCVCSEADGLGRFLWICGRTGFW